MLPLSYDNDFTDSRNQIDGNLAVVSTPIPKIQQRNEISIQTTAFNISNNVTTTSNELNSFYFYETEQFTVLWILFTVIVLGNSSVLLTLFFSKNKKSRMNFFIKQLALADLCVGLLNVLTDIIWRITISWRAGNLACKVIRFMQACVTYASTYVLVALSVDRYDAITRPMNFSGSWRRARTSIAVAWTLSIMFSLPMLVLYEEKLIQDQLQCWIDLGAPWRWQIYMSLVSAVLFVCPAIIIAACYAIIIRTIWTNGALLMDNDRGSRRASSRGIIPRAKVKTVKMTIVIVIVFIICWSPYIVFDLLQVFGQIEQTQSSIAIATLIQSLAPLNSAANPIIYFLFSTQMCRSARPALRWLFLQWCRKGRCISDERGSSSNLAAIGRSSTISTRATSITVSRKSTSSQRISNSVVIVERPKSISIVSSNL